MVSDTIASPEKKRKTSCTIASVIGVRPMVDRQNFSSSEALSKAEAFEARSGDVFLCSFPKTGRTWMQQIMHQLRTGGHVDFEEINEEFLWLEVAPAINMDLNMSQKAAPRCFASHQLLSALGHLEKQGAKFVCLVRDPVKTLVSHFKFMHSHGHAACASGDINEYIKSGFTLGRSDEDDLQPTFGGTLWDHYVEYWQCRSLAAVKVVAFESLLKDLPAQLEELNAFMSLPPLDTERKTRVTELCHKDWMERNGRLFDDHTIAARIKSLQQKEFASVSKVGHEVSKTLNLRLNDESKATIARMWEEKVLPVIGHSSYESMLEELLKG